MSQANDKYRVDKTMTGLKTKLKVRTESLEPELFKDKWGE